MHWPPSFGHETLRILSASLFCLGLAGCNDEDPATVEEIQTLCETMCEWTKGCAPYQGYEFTLTVDECMDTRYLTPEKVTSNYIAHLQDCYTTSTCVTAQQFDDKIPYFYCLNEVFEALKTEESEALTAECLTRKEECRGTDHPIDDDYCQMYPVMVIPSLREELQACWNGDCNVGAECLAALLE